MTGELTGREVECETLERLVQSREPEFLALYGRRRVGKTFLIRSFFEGRKGLFFELTGQHQASLQTHLDIFAEAFSKCFPEEAGLSEVK